MVQAPPAFEALCRKPMVLAPPDHDSHEGAQRGATRRNTAQQEPTVYAPARNEPNWPGANIERKSVGGLDLREILALGERPAARTNVPDCAIDATRRCP